MKFHDSHNWEKIELIYKQTNAYFLNITFF